MAPVPFREIAGIKSEFGAAITMFPLCRLVGVPDAGHGPIENSYHLTMDLSRAALVATVCAQTR
jgi:hypothetical protein